MPQIHKHDRRAAQGLMHGRKGDIWSRVSCCSSLPERFYYRKEIITWMSSRCRSLDELVDIL